MKLDAAFCRSLVRNNQKRQVLELLQQLSHSYKFRLIADGVDDGEVRQLLLELGCFMQGRLINSLQQPNPSSVFLQQLA